MRAGSLVRKITSTARLALLVVVAAVSSATLAQAQSELAIASLKASKRVTLSSTPTAVTKLVKAKIQNLGDAPEIIFDRATLEQLIELQIESLAPTTCPIPPVQLVKPKGPYPITIAPGKKLSLTFEVDFSCANDPLRSTSASPHDDFRYSLTVDASVLGSEGDDPTNDY